MSADGNMVLERVRTGAPVHEIPEWGISVRVRGVTAQHQIWLDDQRRKGGVDKERAVAEMISRGLRHPDTNAKLFTPEQVMQLIEDDDEDVISRVLGWMNRRSGADRDGIERAKRDFSAAPSSEPSTDSLASADAPPPSS